jgi:hypothetical protein
MTEGQAVPFGGGDGSAVDATLVTCLELLRGILARPGFAFSDREVRENLRTLCGLAAAVLDAVKLGFVAELDSRPGAVPGARAGGGALRFLTEGLRQSRGSAMRDVRAAAAVSSADPDLPAMGAALAAGEVSREHLDVAVATLRRVPSPLRRKLVPDDEDGYRTGAQAIDVLLTDQARTDDPGEVEKLGRKIVHHLDPDRADRFDPRAFERRDCTISTDFAGMGLLRLALDPVTTVQVKGVISRFSAPRPAGTATTDDGVTVEVRDERTLGQRQADAVVDLMMAGAATRPEPAPADNDTDDEDDSDEGGEETPAPRTVAPGASRLPSPCPRTDLVVVATVDQFAAAHGATDPAAATAGLARMGLAGKVGTYPGATIHPAVLARLSCDTPIRRILIDENGAPLHHGREKRFATTHQKRALAVRDQGCCIPGCDIPAEWTEAHHLPPWEHGGTTDIDTMALLCRNHHTAHHSGIYDLEIRDGIPRVRMPDWIHPERPWLRNTSHDTWNRARQLLLTLTPPPDAEAA